MIINSIINFFKFSEFYYLIAIINEKNEWLNYLKITCRMYEQKFPNVDDIVMVNKIIKKI